MAYIQNEKSTGLEVLTDLTLTQSDLHIIGDASDSGRAKTITQDLLEDYIANSTNFVDELISNTYFTTNLANDTNFITQLTNNALFQTNVNNFVTGGGASATSIAGKAKSYSLEGLLGEPVQNGYQDIECYITASGTTIYAEFIREFLQTRDVTLDWADADSIESYVVQSGFLYLLLRDNAAPLYRVYRYTTSDITTGGTLMTIATQAFGTLNNVVMTSNGTDFYFNKKAGISANDYIISKYTLAATTLTYVSDITCGAILNTANRIAVLVDGTIYAYSTTLFEFKTFDTGGTLEDTFGNFDSKYVNIINWDGVLYIVKLTGDDETYRIQTPNDSADTGGTKKVGVGDSSNTSWFNWQALFIDTASESNPMWTLNVTDVRTSNVQVDFNGTSTVKLVNPIGFTYIGNPLLFGSGKQVIVEGAVGYGDFNTPQKSGWGLASFIANDVVTQQGTNSAGVCFVTSAGGDFLARCADNAGFTETVIPDFTPNAISVLRIEYDPANTTPQARFYVNGILVATITGSNLPTGLTDAGDDGICFQAGNGNASIGGGFMMISAPSFSFEI